MVNFDFPTCGYLVINSNYLVINTNNDDNLQNRHILRIIAKISGKPAHVCHSAGANVTIEGMQY